MMNFPCKLKDESWNQSDIDSVDLLEDMKTFNIYFNFEIPSTLPRSQ